ncbi:hypothetical protein DYB31_013884 [Aphanomyces astaci]|uniref:Uncharacterized protein n=1 Tax=Aphanomyces astaci TaxID=112090 RepID=A0A397EQ63_APHAT|nr:hypothetical protein DYB31_013884 [Aphanomyces astaci]
MARRTSLQGPHPTSLTTRSINQGVSLLNNLEMQRQAKRTRYSTHLADEPDTDTDSIAPIYDAFLKAQGLEGILTMTNFSPSEFNILWADVRSHLFKHWNVGSGRKSEVTARDLLLMLLTSLKHCGAWDVVAAVFKQKVDSFEKRVMKFLTVLYPFVMRNDTYRWNRKTYDVVFQTCMAFTNAHVRFHPLRAEDGDTNSQYINRLNAIGVNMVKNKNTAQRTYRSKRKARLSMVMAAESSLADADAGGIDTDMGSNSEIENRRGSFF